MALQLLKDHVATLVGMYNNTYAPKLRTVALRRYELMSVGWNKGHGAQTMEELMEYRNLQFRNILVAYSEGPHTELAECDTQYKELQANLDDLEAEVIETLRCIYNLTGIWYQCSTTWDTEKQFASRLNIGGGLF